MTKVKVRIKAINPVVVGNGLNMIEITGYDATNKRGFKKRAFETKQDGSPTAISTALKDAKPGDWFEFTLDDSTYQNPSTATKVAGPAPAGGYAPDASGGSKFKKGEFRSVAELNRDVALNAALKFFDIVKPKAKVTSAKVIALAEKFYSFLTSETADKKQGGRSDSEPPTKNAALKTSTPESNANNGNTNDEGETPNYYVAPDADNGEDDLPF